MLLPRMRTAKAAAEELKKIDPDTVLRECHIRYLMNSGQIPVCSSGRRKFVNLDQLIDFLERSDSLDLGEKQNYQMGIIRQICEGR